MRRALGIAAILAFPAAPALAQQPPLVTTDDLSFVEEPLAWDVYGFTVTANALIDQSLGYSFERDDVLTDTRAQLLIGAETQLPNALTVGGNFLAEADASEDGVYGDRWSIYGRGVWGRLAIGEVGQGVASVTARQPGAGNADLAFDGVFAPLDDGWAAAYALRVSAWTINLAVDIDGNTDAGITYERPGQIVDYRVTGRYTRGEAVETGGVFDAHSFTFVGQVEYGSLLADLGLGYELIEGDGGFGGAAGDRVWVSSGLRYKMNRVTLTAAAHIGTIGGETEVSAALGARYDIARGFSANLGYNFAFAEAEIDGVTVRDVEVSEIIGSLRYEF